MLQHEMPPIVLPSNSAVVRVKGDAEYYTFEYSVDGKAWNEIGKMNTRYLSSECAGGFTGVTIGLYAQSQNADTQATATCAWFKYEGR